MAWKYIMIEATFGSTRIQFPIIFPDKLVHSDVYEAIKNLEPLKSINPSVVSAGSIDQIMTTGVGGESTTLGIKSNMDDEDTIDAYSYVHGIIP